MPWMVFVNKCYINLFFSSSSEPELARLLPFQAQTFGQTAYLKNKEKENIEYTKTPAHVDCSFCSPLKNFPSWLTRYLSRFW